MGAITYIKMFRWFQKTYGNTYHTCYFYDKDFNLVHSTQMEYGYGETCIQTSIAWLEKNGYPEWERHSNGNRKLTPSQYLKENGIDYIIQDVNRKKDL